MKSSPKKRIVISVTNDLTTDQRVKKVCESLTKLNVDILLIGRLLPESVELDRTYDCKRMKLIFNRGVLFYAEYNIRLFIILLFSKADVFHANDLDTLLANYLASKLRRKPLVFDAHEYFTGVPEIQNRILVKKTWSQIENWIFPKLDYVFTVNDAIALRYHKQFGKEMKVMRNIPRKRKVKRFKSKHELHIPEDKNIIITQGAGINIDRGIEEAVEAMQYLNNICFIIIGNGDVIPHLKKRVLQLKLENSVIFKNKMPYEEMMQYTHHAELGLTLDKDTNTNYKLSLPNKLFDYIHAGIPILASKIMEVEKIVHHYNIGLLIENHDPRHIAHQIETALKENLKTKYESSLEKAAQELCWEHEEKKLIKLYKKIAG